MSITQKYVAFDESWSVTLTDAIRKGQVGGLTELADHGAVGQSTIVLDDPDGTLGHSGDHITHHQRFRWDDSVATPHRVAELWTMGRGSYHSTSDSLRIGVERKLEVKLEDGNTLAGRIPIPPKSVDSSVDRPEESAAARIAHFLGTVVAAGITDTGFVHPTSTTMDANNCEGMHLADVLNDICTQNGDNWFVRWDRDADDWGLFIFNFDTYDGDTGTLQLSNDPALVDSGLDGTWSAGGSNCWAVMKGARIDRDPSEYVNRLDLRYANSAVERTATHTGYPTVGRTASTTNVKKSATAIAKADRILADNADEVVKATCKAQIGRASVNSGLVGQLITASFVEDPEYADPSPWRIVRRSPSQVDPSDEFYTVEFELVPAHPASAVYSYAELVYPQQDSATGPVLLNWANWGDNPRSPRIAHPLTGNMAYDATGVNPATPSDKTGIKMTGSGTIAIHCQAGFEFGYTSGTHDVTLNVYVGATLVGTATYPDPGSGIHAFGGYLTIDLPSVTVATNDILTAQLSWSGSAAIWAIPIAGTDGNTYMSASGYLV